MTDAVLAEAAPAKLNLALHVRARRADGYHELETLFAFCRDGDRLEIARTEAPSFAVIGPFAAALAGEADNLVLRAVRAFAEVFGDPGPLAITLTKNLPVASGLGGGSADAAAALRGLARLAGFAGDPRLVEIATGLGSDVPACLLGRAALGRGRGERLMPVAGLAAWPVLLVNPGVPVATGPVFAGWDGVDRGPLADGDPLAAALAGRNDLEASARRLAPVIGDVLDALMATRPILARMSGSGATCFALFRSGNDCSAAAQVIRSARPGWWCFETALA